MDSSSHHEQTRIAVLRSFQILDSPSEAIFDRLTRLAARICETPIAVLTLVDSQRQWFKSVVGLTLQETERNISFCTHAVATKKLLVVEDARTDPRFQHNPLVTGDPGIVFYAGAPLVTAQGFALGALAVIDRVPRSLTRAQNDVLMTLADEMMMHIEMRLQHQQLESLAAERDRINAALRRQTEHLKKAQRIAKTGSWELRMEEGRLVWSEEVYRIFGVRPADHVPSPESFMAFVHPADRQALDIAQREALAGNAPLDLEHRIIRADGQVRHVHERAEAVRGGQILAGTVQDVTLRRETEEQMHLLRTCVSRLQDIVMISEVAPDDPATLRIVFVNNALEQVTGYSAPDMVGRTPAMLHGPKTQRGELDRLQAALAARAPVSIEIISYKKSGEEFWAEIDVTPITDASGRLTHCVAIYRDVTARKQRMEELANSHRALEMLSRCNEALIRTEHEQELLNRICQLAVHVGGYKMAWVGYANDDPERSVRKVAHAGASHELAGSPGIGVSWSETEPLGQGPGGRAIRSGMPVVLENVAEDPSFAPWQSLARKDGYNRVICLPLRSKERTFGLLGLHSAEARPVVDREIKLLQEVADNLAYGIGTIRLQKERRRIEAAVAKVASGISLSTGTEFFDQLARNMAEALGARVGCVVRYLPGQPPMARTVSAVIDGKTVENFDYPLKGTPCEHVTAAVDCLVPDSVAKLFPDAPVLGPLGAHAYAGRRLDSSAGQPLGMIFVLFDAPIGKMDLIASTLQIFAARAAAELERQEADARIRSQASLLDKAQDAIIVCGTDYRILFWNKGAERLYGWDAGEALGRSKMELIYDDPADGMNAAQAVMEEGEWRGEARQRRKDGTTLVAEAHWTLVKDEQGSPQSILAINTDITQRKKAEQEIERLAFFDPLTRLPNRRLLLDRLAQAVAACGRNGHTGALLFIDLDNFKSLNDTLGHDKGDMLLQQVARRLEACVRRNNTVARLGGDEFIIMLEDLSGQAREAATQADIVGEKILASFARPFHLEGAEHHSSPSIGVTLFDDQSGSVDELLKRADLAMYQAKASGRNTIRFFDPEMQEEVNARVALENDFRHGLQNREFQLHYQAQTDGYGQVRGVEALVRWQHSRRGLVSPMTFIPLAEETGLIMRLGHWVLETACTQLAYWANSTQTADLSVAVNVSARQFHHPNFVEQVLGILDYTGANPKRLKLELTESLLVKNVEDTIAKMNALKARGIGFSLDDFGTGYSSLSYLKRFPLDQLKIDRSFVRDVLVDANDAAIARTIMALGQILGLEVIAEGVETEEQRDFLARHGCHAYQGFLFSHPVPAEQFRQSPLVH